MKYYLIILICFLICGCSPSRDTELSKIWWDDQALVLTDGDNDIIFTPHWSYWVSPSKSVSEDVLYTIKNSNSIDSYVVKRVSTHGNSVVYQIIRVYSNPLVIDREYQDR